MKLLQKTTRLHFWSTALIFIVASIALLLILRWLVNEELDEQLELKAQRQEQLVAKGITPTDPLTSIIPYEGARILSTYGDTAIYDKISGEEEAYRQLIYTNHLHGKKYKIWVASSRLEWEDFYQVIFWVFVSAFILLLLVEVLSQRLLTKKLWSPFFRDLTLAEKASVKDDIRPTWSETNIAEFQQMQNTLDSFIASARKDYQSLRDFSGNASHEMQTPLAVLSSKLDRMSQHEQLDEELSAAIAGARDAVNRLSKLSRNLLLLTKLENRQFSLDSKVDVVDVIRNLLEQMRELFEAREIEIKLTLPNQFEIVGNAYLVETLVNNLLSNALRYSKSGGVVEININDNVLEVSNPGDKLPFEKEAIFRRFQKGSQTNSGTGLGLAIVKELCDLSGWEIGYRFLEGRHCFRVVF